MKKRIVYGALYAAFALGAIANCLFGRAGIASYRALEDRAEALRRNIVDLQDANAGLSADLARLQHDPATVRLLARQLGYLAPGETRVLLPTYEPDPSPRAVGFIMQAPPSLSARPFRAETLYLLPLLVLFVALSIDASRPRHDG